MSHVSCKQPTILQLSRLPATAKPNRTLSPLTNFRINDSENKFWDKIFKQTSWQLTLTTTLTLPENASSSKTHTHYATRGSRRRMHEEDEAAVDCARERTSGHERKNHSGASHAVVTVIF